MQRMAEVSMLPVQIEKIENFINDQADQAPCIFEFEDGFQGPFVVCNNPDSDPMQMLHIGIAVVPYHMYPDIE